MHMTDLKLSGHLPAEAKIIERLVVKRLDPTRDDYRAALIMSVVCAPGNERESK